MDRPGTSPSSHRARAIACTLAAVFTVCTAVGLASTPAGACSCMPLDDAAAFEGADVVFVGELVGHRPPPAAATMSSADPATWTFEVSEVFKGEARATQEVVSAWSGASCGLELPDQGTFLVFADRDTGEMATGPDQLHAGLCGGTRLGGPPADFVDLGRPPKPVAAPAAEPPAGSRSGDGLVSMPVAVAAGAAVVAAAAALALHRRRRTSA